MTHVAKYTDTQIWHLINHYNRKNKKDCNRSNEDIDKTRTKENYNINGKRRNPKEL